MSKTSRPIVDFSNFLCNINGWHSFTHSCLSIISSIWNTPVECKQVGSNKRSSTVSYCLCLIQHRSTLLVDFRLGFLFLQYIGTYTNLPYRLPEQSHIVTHVKMFHAFKLYIVVSLSISKIIRRVIIASLWIWRFFSKILDTVLLARFDVSVADTVEKPGR